MAELVARRKSERVSPLRRRHSVNTVGLTSAVSPFDATNTGSRAGDIDEEAVAWFAQVKPGVRVHVELAVSGEGEVHVVSWRVTDVGDVTEGAGADAGDRLRSDLEVGAAVTIDGPFSQRSGSFGQPDGHNGGGDGDKDAVPGVHDADTTVWPGLAARMWHRSNSVRLTLLAELAS